MRLWIEASILALVASGAVAMSARGGAAEPRHGAPQALEAKANCQDADGDGFGIGCSAGADCNDADSAIHPGMHEVCNFRDDDCSGLVDDDASCAQPTPNPEPVRVKESWLVMGSPSDQGAADERPQHRVRISAFSIDRHEVTNLRYAACVRAGVCQPPVMLTSAKRLKYFGEPEFANYPVIFVGWLAAEQFCRWDGGRLPSEAEWELAARGAAPNQRVFPWGDEPADCLRANLGGNKSCVGDTDLVGRRALGISPWGAQDMAGNVWEWTADWYDPDYYSRSPARDPQGPVHGALKVMRGGCWASGADSLRVSCRKPELPGTWAPNVGFRCARSNAEVAR